MNRLYSSLLAATALTFTAAAQQLPNAGFEEAWVDCVPWTSAGNTTVEGITPTSWNVSNTVGTGASNYYGRTTIAEKVAGYNSSSAVYLLNKEITVKLIVSITKTIPGYVGLGTSWATSVGTNNMAGGQFGGYSFAYRPDALQFMYQSAGSVQPTVIAYTWNGTFVQENVSGNIAAISSSSIKKVTMKNRDRCVLGMDAPQGGEVTQKGTLVASINTRIDATTTEWTEGNLEFTYADASVPEMINVIFAAGDYFSTSPVKDNSITVDDVKLIYYSRLKSLKVNGIDVEGFESNKYEYTIETAMPTDASAIAAECLGNSGSGKAVVALDAANNKATITVTNSNAGGTDVDGEISHVYTVNFKDAESKDPNTKDYPGTLEITMEGEPVTTTPEPATVEITPNADYTACTFLLPNLTLSNLGLNLGDIKMENVEMTHNGGVTTFKGGPTAMTLVPEGAEEGSAINADVTVNGTCDSEGNLKMQIAVIWHSGSEDDGGFGDVNIAVTFNGKGDPIKTSAIGGIEVDDENAPVEYYNIQGVKVNGDNLAPGFYIVRQGKKVSKIFVK